MLEKIKLHNFRQHKDTVLEFVPGINTIVGENNSGKSTIPEAIEFALYGSRALRDSAKGFIMDGEQDGSAVVRLSLAEDIYTVGRNSKNAELRKNGVLEGQYKDNVTKDVCTITGVNQTGFRLGHYVRQKELSAFSNMRPGKRHETIEKMLKVHAVDKAIARVKDEYSELELKQKVLYSQYTDIEAVENELDDLYIVKQMLLERGEKCQTQLDGIKDTLEAYRAQHTERIAAITKKAYNDKLLAQWESDCTQASLALVELETAKSEYVKLDWSIYDTVKQQVDELHAIEVSAAKMSAIKKELDTELVVPIEVLEPEPVDKSTLQALEAEIQIKQQQLDALKCLVDKPCCPTCNQALPNIAAVVNALSVEIADLQPKRKELNTELATALSKYTNDNNKFKQYQTQKMLYNEKVIARAKLLETYVEVEFSEEEKILAETKLKDLQSIKETSIRLEGEIKRLEGLAVEPVKPDVVDPIIGPFV